MTFWKKGKCFFFCRMEPVKTGLLSPFFVKRCSKCGWEYRHNAIAMTSGWVAPKEENKT